MLPTSKIQAIGLLVAVAVAGFAAGAATISYASDHSRAAARDWREQCSFSGVLQRELRLSDVQRDSLRAIMRRYRPEMRAIFDVVRPRMDSVRARMTAEMRGVLTPAQQAAFDSLRERERAERARADSAAAPAGGR